MSFLAEGWARVIMVAEICLHDVSVISDIFFLLNLIFFLAICRDACSTFRQPSIRFSTSTPNSPGVTAFAYILLHMPTNPTLSPMHYAC